MALCEDGDTHGRYTASRRGNMEVYMPPARA